jgi:hypothetical protein
MQSPNKVYGCCEKQKLHLENQGLATQTPCAIKNVSGRHFKGVNPEQRYSGEKRKQLKRG